jgi:hypothetical protein
MKTPDWYKIKGYYHISPKASISQSSINRNIKRITNPDYVSKYGFFPLLHVIIKQRRFKKDPTTKKRSYTSTKNGVTKSNAKERPLHYANHQDALIFSYYAQKFSELYEIKLKECPAFSDTITAYRKILDLETQKGKSNIHFAKEVFDEIKSRTVSESECIALAFDIESYFSSLDHVILKNQLELITGRPLNPDQQNVFNASTNFSFVYKNDLRNNIFNKRKKNLDEKKLAKIRNKLGFDAFFESPKDFRNAVKDGSIRVYKNSFKNKLTGKIKGIPQGLPISAVFGNIYLYQFDKKIYTELVESRGCFYRRYSDDIIILTTRKDSDFVLSFIDNEISKFNVHISRDKTEQFAFKKILTGNSYRIKCFGFDKKESNSERLLTYLGFQFDGEKPLIKSANLSKFYRRMIYAVKRKCRRAIKLSDESSLKPVIFKRQLYKMYRSIDLDKETVKFRNFKRFTKIETGEFRLTVEKMKDVEQGNYFSYVKRASEIMDEPAILKQLRNERKIFNQAIVKHLNK